MSSWDAILWEPARVILAQIGNYLMKILVLIILLIIGWIISRVIRSVVTKSLRAVKLDEFSDRIELEALLEKGGISYSLSELIGLICYWLIILVSFMVAIDAVGLTIAADLLRKVILYVPNVISAVFILILGMFASTILKNLVVTAANNAGLSQGKLLGKVAEGIVIAFAIFVGLEQLRIGIQITQLTISIVLGSIGFGLALAFGLGCKELAGKFMNDFIEKMKKK